MKRNNWIILFYFLLVNHFLAQINTTPCDAQPVCPNSMVTGLPLGNLTFGHTQACSFLSSKPTLFYKANILTSGVFTFRIRPGVDLNGDGWVDPNDPNEIANVDYDWAVWHNVPCSNISRTDAIRISRDVPTPIITGLDVNDNDLCEGPSGGDGVLKGINVNAGDELIIAINYYSNTNGSIPPFQLIVGGVNGGGGNVKFSPMNYNLVDKNGTVKNKFCVGEDIFIKGSGASSSSYIIKVTKYDSSTNTLFPFFNSGFTGTPNQFNLTKGYNGSQFQSASNMTLAIQIENSCRGYDEILKSFTLECCDMNDVEPTFSLSNKNGSLIATSNHVGLYEVYPISVYTGELLPKVFSENVRAFSIPLNDDAPACYYVKYTPINYFSCGGSGRCISQRYCSFKCNDKLCNLSTPQNVSLNPVNNELSWDPIVDAFKYLIEIVANDFDCCGGGLVAAASDTKYITTTNTSEILDLNLYTNNSEIGTPIRCFSYRVYAICPDGTRSNASEKKCFGDPAARGFAPVTTNENIINKNSTDNYTLKVYPNPATAFVTIDLFSIKNTEYTAHVYDNMGKLVKFFSNNKVHGGKSTILWNT